jgi:hypothetical protein
VDAAHIGKRVRCKHCGAFFSIPDPQVGDPDVYELEPPANQIVTEDSGASGQEAVFVPARRERLAPADRPRGVGQPASSSTLTRVRMSESRFPWQSWLIRGGIAVVSVLTALALFVPHGTWLVGCILIAIGGVLVPVAYFAGAYGAFSEDTLYGLLYLFFPLYIGYYLVTRWEDLWPWMLCATVGVGLVLFGTELVRWSGVTV